MKSICNYCRKEYEVCPNCEDSGVFKYRLYYCCTDCFKNAMEKGDKMDRIQYDGKVYNVLKHDFKNGKFLLHRDKIEVEVEDTDEKLQAYIIVPETYMELKYGKFTKRISKEDERSDNKEE